MSVTTSWLFYLFILQTNRISHNNISVLLNNCTFVIYLEYSEAYLGPPKDSRRDSLGD